MPGNENRQTASCCLSASGAGRRTVLIHDLRISSATDISGLKKGQNRPKPTLSMTAKYPSFARGYLVPQAAGAAYEFKGGNRQDILDQRCMAESYSNRGAGSGSSRTGYGAGAPASGPAGVGPHGHAPRTRRRRPHAPPSSPHPAVAAAEWKADDDGGRQRFDVANLRVRCPTRHSASPEA